MESVRKLSMNTSLKNARIFDDDAWEEKGGREVQKEKTIEPKIDTMFILNNIKVEPQYCDIENKIKIEPQDDVINKIKLKPRDNDVQNKIKMELHDDVINKIKLEPRDNDVQNKIKMEPKDDDIKYTFNDTLEEGELKDSFCSHQLAKEFACKTPPSPSYSTITPVPDRGVDTMFDESPYNKELFNTLRIQEVTPIKPEDEESNNDTKNTLKSAKRTVFNRHSPYKRIDNDEVCEKRISAKSRLGPKVSDVERPRKQPRREVETDSGVLIRREKQIEYGKNTIGYDNYTNLVPREKRQPGDPQTPDKFEKYSRRGWDGLIRQWRLQLHKYDPADTENKS